MMMMMTMTSWCIKRTSTARCHILCLRYQQLNSRDTTGCRRCLHSVVMATSTSSISISSSQRLRLSQHSLICNDGTTWAAVHSAHWRIIYHQVLVSVRWPTLVSVNVYYIKTYKYIYTLYAKYVYVSYKFCAKCKWIFAQFNTIVDQWHTCRDVTCYWSSRVSK